MRVIPFGDRILVKRRVVGEKLGKDGLLYAPETTSDRPTDLADVIFVPDNTFADKELLDNADEIITSLMTSAKHGDSDALIALLRLNEYVKIKTIKTGDCVMISRYVGTDFHSKESSDCLTLVASSDVIGVLK